MRNTIKERRLELGITQAQLAKQCGTGQSTIAEIEEGKHMPGIELALRIAAALDRKVEDLFLID